MSDIVKSCGFCGSPMDAQGHQVWPIPEGYDPDDYPHDVCNACRERDMTESQRYVTHEMALDAGDPDLEGQPL